MGTPWYGVDLDATLARYDGWRGADVVGEPIPLMVERVRGWLDQGIDVRILTARASHDDFTEGGLQAIQIWCMRHLGQALPVTCVKDSGMVRLYDDRARQVIPNTGEVVGDEPEPPLKSRLAGWSTAELQAAYGQLEEDLAKAAPLDAAAYRDKYDALAEQIGAKVEGYASQVAAGRMSAAQFRQLMTGTLRTGYTQAYRFGASEAAGERATLSDVDLAAIVSRFGGELDYLDAFARAITDRGVGQDKGQLNDAYLTNRAGMYADALRSSYWEGRVSRGTDQTAYLWHAVDGPTTCSNCAELDGQYFTADTLPGMPGSDVCQGLSNCRCELEEVSASDLPADVRTELFGEAPGDPADSAAESDGIAAAAGAGDLPQGIVAQEPSIPPGLGDHGVGSGPSTPSLLATSVSQEALLGQEPTQMPHETVIEPASLPQQAPVSE
jgi:hypothetical protein